MIKVSEQTIYNEIKKELTEDPLHEFEDVGTNFRIYIKNKIIIICFVLAEYPMIPSQYRWKCAYPIKNNQILWNDLTYSYYSFDIFWQGIENQSYFSPYIDPVKNYIEKLVKLKGLL